jgi:hypothetical protein
MGDDGAVDEPGAGDRMLLWCDGGPAPCRVATWPPPLEIAEPGGVYVLVDVGPPADWRYIFVPAQP